MSADANILLQPNLPALVWLIMGPTLRELIFANFANFGQFAKISAKNLKLINL